MKKVGIITHYYKSENYGGNLQAYALTTYLSQHGYQAEQISFRGNFDVPKKKQKRDLRFWTTLPFRAIKSLIIRGLKIVEESIHHVSQRRMRAFSDFNDRVIPHSSQVYTCDNIRNCVHEYDAFITGSDQVWNLKWYNPEFFLQFVPSEKKKIAYAASMAADHLTTEQKKIVENHLRDFDAISVREEEAVTLLSPLASVQIVQTLDPTLLLSGDDWDHICSERKISEEYLFCYFLSSNRKLRRLARSFAKKNHLKLVTIPHSGGWIKTSDIGFGDVRCFDASPEDFLSLIKYARYVFTDSFHAVAFSHIYQKQFFVFNRKKDEEMSSRISGITAIFGTEERFCYDADRANMQYIASLKEIDYNRKNSMFDEMLKNSVSFFIDSLKLDTVG